MSQEGADLKSRHDTPQPDKARPGGSRGWSRAALVVRLIAVPVGLGVVLMWLWSYVDVQARADMAGHAALAFVVFSCSSLLVAVRLSIVLRLGGGSIPVLTAVKLHFRAMFYNLFFPMGAGAEIAKFAILKKHWAGRRASLATLLVVDRLLGLIGFSLVACGLGFVLFGGWVWPALLALVLCGVVVAVSAGRLVIAYLPRRYADQLEEIRTMLAKRPTTVAWASLVAVFIPVVMGLAVWVLQLGLGHSLGPASVVFANAGAFVFQAIPVQVFGAGGAEAAGLVIYSVLGLSLPAVNLLVASAYGLRLLTGLVGGLIEVSGAYAQFPVKQRRGPPK